MIQRKTTDLSYQVQLYVLGQVAYQENFCPYFWLSVFSFAVLGPVFLARSLKRLIQLLGRTLRKGLSWVGAKLHLNKPAKEAKAVYPTTEERAARDAELQRYKEKLAARQAVIVAVGMTLGKALVLAIAAVGIFLAGAAVAFIVFLISEDPSGFLRVLLQVVVASGIIFGVAYALITMSVELRRRASRIDRGDPTRLDILVGKVLYVLSLPFRAIYYVVLYAGKGAFNTISSFAEYAEAMYKRRCPQLVIVDPTKPLHAEIPSPTTTVEEKDVNVEAT